MARRTHIEGTDRLIRQLQALGREGQQQVAGELEARARDIAASAKQLAPGNFGKLKQGIDPEKQNELNWEIVSHAPYAGYVEFGTGVKVNVPAEMQEVATALKNNPKGSFEDGLRSIQDWCRAKGIDERAAYPIFMSILEKGLRPQPYLYPAWVQGGKKLKQNLKRTLDVLTRRFNNAR